jgi:di/tricarboxylate transporter
MLFSVVLGLLSMLEAAMVASGLMLLTRCTTGSIARRSVDWSVLVVIAASFGIGTALRDTGAAAAIAENLISMAQGSPWAALGLVYVATALFTALATNNAAAVLMFPIALATAENLGVSFLPFVMTIMIGASASFATPIGYQTNLMVFGAGGYHFADYLRIGLPLTILVGITTVAIAPLVWPFV